MRRQIFHRACHSSSTLTSPYQILLRNSPGRPRVIEQLRSSHSSVSSPRRLTRIPQPLPGAPIAAQSPLPFLRHGSPPRQNTASDATRPFSSSRAVWEAQKSSTPISYKEERHGKTVDPDEQDDDQGFAKTEKAAQASQLDLSAKLGKDGAQGGMFCALWASNGSLSRALQGQARVNAC